MTLDVVTRDTVAEAVRAQAQAARDSLPVLAAAGSDRRARALGAAATALRDARAAVLDANAADLAFAREKGVRASLMDRLQLDDARVESMAAGLDAIAAFPDPVGRVRDSWTRPNGLRIERVSVPLGVIGIIYESRPNVTADAGGLCLKAGNAAILRGGSESLHSSRIIVDCLAAGLDAAGLPRAAVQLVPTRDRDAVGALLALDGLIDVIVPRGGRGLIERVMRETRIPVIAHLDGLCHVYVDAAADPTRARAIVVNAKMRRTSVCGAAETVLLDRALPGETAAAVVRDLIEAGCEVRGDGAVRALDARVREAGPADWDTEYLDAIVSIREVDGIDEAIAHIARHGSHHTDAVVTEDATVAERFLGTVDSAIVLHNASTQFADGGEFGMGAEIGISTGRLHARGPVGAEQLTSFKYVVRGDGHTRP